VLGKAISCGFSQLHLSANYNLPRQSGDRHSTKEKSQMTYYYFKDHKGEWRWLLKAANGRLIATSGEAYEAKEDCLYDIELVKGSSSCLVKKQ
jgi:uncharacterized protein YegP (UPF0339 family)